jgi:hypothetical protein
MSLQKVKDNKESEIKSGRLKKFQNKYCPSNLENATLF